MNVVTIPKQLVTKTKDDLVVLSRKEYEALFMMSYGTFTATPKIKRALRRAEKNLKLGKSLTLNELKKRLGIAS